MEINDAVVQEALAARLGTAYGAPVRVEHLRRESGGASRLTYSFDAVLPSEAVPGGANESTRHELILRMETPGQSAGGPLLQEAALMQAAAEAGVPTPRVIATGDETSSMGAAFVVMDRVAGETIPRRILRDEQFAAVRPDLARQCGRILASIHTIPPDRVPGLTGTDPLQEWRTVLDATGEPHPALEFGLRRLELERPEPGRQVVVHGDFRNGNLIVGPEGIRAVLDWELAHLGDPLEDLGWLCVKAWRFGATPPVGGFGQYDDLVTAYEQAAETKVDRDALHWWETLGVLKWAIICIIQSQRHLTGSERSVELAALGRRTAENEWDLLHML